MKSVNPSTIVAPASNYSQGVLLDAAAGKRLIISGQIGVTPAGEIAQGTEAQMRQAWANLFAVIEDAGMAVTDLVKVTVFITEPAAVGLYRTVRDELLQGHSCASTLLIVAGLAAPELTVEIEAEAITTR